MSSTKNAWQHVQFWMRQGLGTPLMLVVMLGMMILPLPPFLLDVFLPLISLYR